MPYKGKLNQPVETAISKAIEIEFNQYKKYNERTFNWKSKRAAFLARKHLIRLKKLAHKRGIEILNLYTTDKRRLNGTWK